MEKIKSYTDLKLLKENLQKQSVFYSQDVRKDTPVLVRVAMATCGIASGAKEIMTYLKDEFEKRSINAFVMKTGCMGYCYAEPTLEVTLPGKKPVVFGYVTREKADEIIEKYIKNGELPQGVIPDLYQTIDME